MADDPASPDPPVATPENWLEVVEFHRDMAARFAESRDELKHRCRDLEGQLVDARVQGHGEGQEHAMADMHQALAALVIQWRADAAAPSLECPDCELVLQRCADDLAARLKG